MASKSNGDVVVVDLPDDIMYNILHRLPTKSLVRFQSVFKCITEDRHFLDSRWGNCFIVAPKFLHASRPNYFTLIEKTADGYAVTTRIPIKHTIINDPPPRDYFMDCSDEDNNYDSDEDNNYDSDEDNNYDSDEDSYISDGEEYYYYDKDARIVSYCNGLFCIDDHDISVYNPITMESEKLPGSQKKKKCENAREIYLGFDATIRKYKVVRISLGFDCAHRSFFQSGDIITLGDSSWRTLNLPKEFDFQEHNYYNASSYYSKSDSVFLEGAFHWLIQGKDRMDYYKYIVAKYYKHIVAMDIDNESFRVIRLPHMEREFPKMEIVNLDTSVALVGYTDIHTCIWKLVDSKKGTWNYHYKYDISPVKRFYSFSLLSHQPIVMPRDDSNMLMKVCGHYGLCQIGSYDSSDCGNYEIILGLSYDSSDCGYYGPQEESYYVFPFVPNFISGFYEKKKMKKEKKKHMCAKRMFTAETAIKTQNSFAALTIVE